MEVICRQTCSLEKTEPSLVKAVTVPELAVYGEHVIRWAGRWALEVPKSIESRFR
jgi:hypothetical protein